MHDNRRGILQLSRWSRNGSGFMHLGSGLCALETDFASVFNGKCFATLPSIVCIRGVDFNYSSDFWKQTFYIICILIGMFSPKVSITSYSSLTPNPNLGVFGSSG